MVDDVERALSQPCCPVEAARVVEANGATRPRNAPPPQVRAKPKAKPTSQAKRPRETRAPGHSPLSKTVVTIEETGVAGLIREDKTIVEVDSPVETPAFRDLFTPDDLHGFLDGLSPEDAQILFETRQRLKAERLEKERAEKERAEKERLENERLENERLENERLENERVEKERLEKERLENERLENERLEKERLEKERLEKERLENERLENERIKAEKDKLLPGVDAITAAKRQEDDADLRARTERRKALLAAKRDGTSVFQTLRDAAEAVETLDKNSTEDAHAEVQWGPRLSTVEFEVTRLSALIKSILHEHSGFDDRITALEKERSCINAQPMRS